MAENAITNKVPTGILNSLRLSVTWLLTKVFLQIELFEEKNKYPLLVSIVLLFGVISLVDDHTRVYSACSFMLLIYYIICNNDFLKSIDKKEKIGIFGDYDVDGATSTALLGKYFTELNLPYEIYIPDRKKEGYGPTIKSFTELINNGVKIIFTVDCGTLSFDAIDYAKNKYKKQGKFYCEDINKISNLQPNTFDFVVSIGVIHHLNNNEAITLLNKAKKYLKPGGVLTTMDPIFIKNQSRISRFMMNNDRGDYIRNIGGYRELFSRVFKKTDDYIVNDMLMYSYEHYITHSKK